jgi:hypothetical protein
VQIELRNEFALSWRCHVMTDGQDTEKTMKTVRTSDVGTLSDDVGKLILRITLAVLILFHGISKGISGVAPAEINRRGTRVNLRKTIPS